MKSEAIWTAHLVSKKHVANLQAQQTQQDSLRTQLQEDDQPTLGARQATHKHAVEGEEAQEQQNSAPITEDITGPKRSRAGLPVFGFNRSMTAIQIPQCLHRHPDYPTALLPLHFLHL